MVQMSRAQNVFHPAKVVRSCLHGHSPITFAAIVPAYTRGFRYFASEAAYGDFPISEFWLYAPSYEHLPSYQMKGGVQ